MMAAATAGIMATFLWGKESRRKGIVCTRKENVFPATSRWSSVFVTLHCPESRVAGIL